MYPLSANVVHAGSTWRRCRLQRL